MARSGVRLLALLRSRPPAPDSRDVHEPELPANGRGRASKNLRDWGIPLGRRFRALKLWTLIRSEGVTALQARLRRDLDERVLACRPGALGTVLRVLAPVPLQTICIRHRPPGLAGEALDQHTLAWADRVNQSGGAYLTPAILDDRWMVRVSVGAELTERQHVEALWGLIRREANAEGLCSFGS